MRSIRPLLSLSFLLLTILSFLTLQKRASLPYNDLGNYYDAEEMVNYTDSGIIFYVLCTFVFGLLTIVFAYQWWKKSR